MGIEASHLDGKMKLFLFDEPAFKLKKIYNKI